MKRFVFWFVTALIGVCFFVHHLRSGPPPEQRLVYRSADGTLQTLHLGRHDKVAIRSTPGQPDLIRVEGRHGRRLDLIADDVRPSRNRRDGDDPASDFDFDDARVSVEGLPVQVVPGTRTTEAKIEPPQPVLPRAPKAPRPLKRPRKPPMPPLPPGGPINHAADVSTITGRLSATELRAVEDAAQQLRQKLAEQLGSNVPTGWKIPDHLIAEMLRPGSITLRAVPRDYGTMYEATIKIDHWSRKQVRVVHAYRQEEVRKRLLILGGVLAFVLVCLAVLSGYIKVDEATKGYYTSKLRIAAAAGVGAAGVLLYEWLKS